jgi:hypothetical protein
MEARLLELRAGRTFPPRMILILSEAETIQGPY